MLLLGPDRLDSHIDISKVQLEAAGKVGQCRINGASQDDKRGIGLAKRQNEETKGRREVVVRRRKGKNAGSKHY